MKRRGRDGADRPLMNRGDDDADRPLMNRGDARDDADRPSMNRGRDADIPWRRASHRRYSGGIDNSIKAWDLRTDEVSYELKGHGDTVTGLKLSPDCSKLLSNGMDHTLRAWDVRPFAAETRELTVFEGHQHDFHKNLLRCAWSHDGEKVACGSSDQVVHVWDVATSEELYYLPGHKGAVTEVDFHPKEPIVGSSSSDMTVYLGEIA